MRQSLKFRKIVALCFAIISFLHASYASSSYAQAWKAFADQIRNEARGDASTNFDATATATDEFAEPETRRRIYGELPDDGANNTGAAVDPEEEAARLALEANATFAPSPPSYRSFPEQRADARLNDICFVSPTTGWAVGDRGAIWKTVDAGQTWNLCEVPTDVNLFAVSFYDANYGLAVGGRVMPLTRGGQGVVLRTIDGGTTWGIVETAAFPILRDVRILDPEIAWIAGDSSTMYPSGLFTSVDTGVSWDAVTCGRHAGWKAILYDPDERLGVGVTSSGEVQRLEGDAFSRPTLSLGTRRLSDVVYDGSVGTAWLVGEQGLVMKSTDFGVNWASTSGGFPEGANNYFELTTVFAKDGFVGTVGSPGSVFFRSDDGGHSWQGSGTGITTPLRKIFFWDSTTGWAVGDLGTIIATRDGGATWQTQRRGGARAATLGVFGRVDDVPLEAFAMLSCEEGYLAEIALMTRETEYEATSDEVQRVERLNEALVEVGALGLEQPGLFQLDPAVQNATLEQILARFDAENDGRAKERLRERLVRLIREWRPSVVLAADPTKEMEEIDATIETRDDVNAKNHAQTSALLDLLAADARRVDVRPRDPFLETLLSEIADAIKDAADPTVYPEHITLCKLEPWRVRKARALCRGGSQGDMTIDSGYYCPSVGRTVGEIARNAREILADDSTPQAAISFQTLFTDGSPQYANKTFFDGITLDYGSDARRAKQTSLAEMTETLANRAGQRRQRLALAETLAKQSVTTPRSADLFIGQLQSNLVGLDEELALEYISSSGKLFANIGAWRAAESIFAATPPTLYHAPQSRYALAWLMQYYCGTEPTRRTSLQNNDALNEDPGTRLNNARRLADAIRSFAPDAFMAPEIRFPFAVAQIATGDYQGAMRFYLNRSQISPGGTGTGGGTDDVWAVRAAAEYWLRAPKGDIGSHVPSYSPLSVARCARAPAKPFLDGILEHEIWDAASQIDLSTPFQEAPTREPTNDEKIRAQWRAKNRLFSQPLGTNLYLLVDDEYLYVGATCLKQKGYVYTPTTDDKLPRQRDPKQTSKDRIEISLDLDGDYVTAAKFVFDADGRVADSLWNDASWNPKLFVANAQTQDAWTIEAAIPIASFAHETPRHGAVWRFAVRRITPGVGVECWNVENSERGENAWGFLIFE